MNVDPKPNMTPKRRQYLERLRDVGHAEEGRGRVHVDLMFLEWICYGWRDKNRGDVISGDTARERYGEYSQDWGPHVEACGELITPLGREALNFL